MKNFFKNVRSIVARCTAFLVALAYRLSNFFGRVYLATVILAASVVASVLESLVVHVIELKGLDLNPPPPALPEPTIDDAWGSSSYHAPRKQFVLPYMPSWVSASLKDPSKHPGYAARRSRPEVLINVDGPLQATAPVVSDACATVEGHSQPTQLVNNESCETISGTVSTSILDIH